MFGAFCLCGVGRGGTGPCLCVALDGGKAKPRWCLGLLCLIVVVYLISGSRDDSTLYSSCGMVTGIAC